MAFIVQFDGDFIGVYLTGDETIITPKKCEAKKFDTALLAKNAASETCLYYRYSHNLFVFYRVIEV